MPKRTAKKSAKKSSARTAKKKAGKATKRATRKVAKKPAPKKKARKSSKASSPRSAPKAASGTSRRGENRLMQLRQLIELMVDRDVVEVELEESGARWRVRRTEPQAVSFAAAPSMPVAAAPAVPAAAAPVEVAPAAPAAESEVYTSPMLGTFYQAPSPDTEAFVKAGDRVNAETTLCIIEAMKVMNEIKAEREFEVVEVLVKNGEPVEFGQPLFLIR